MGGFALSKIKPRRRSFRLLTRSRTPLSDKANKASNDVSANSSSSTVSKANDAIKIKKALADGSSSSGSSSNTDIKVDKSSNDGVAEAPAPPADAEAIDSCSSTEVSTIVTYESSNDDSTLSSIHSTSLTSFAQNLSPPEIEFLTDDRAEDMLTRATPSASIKCRARALKKNRSAPVEHHDEAWAEALAEQRNQKVRSDTIAVVQQERDSPATSATSKRSSESYQSGSVVGHLNALYKLKKRENEDSQSTKNEAEQRIVRREEVDLATALVEVGTRGKSGRGSKEGKKGSRACKGRRGLYEM